MLTDFFKLNGAPVATDLSAFNLALENGVVKDANLAFEKLEDRKIPKKQFINVSFKRMHVTRVEFHGCHFNDCLFLGTQFTDCEFHDCLFENCNLFKIRLREVYAKPKQFRSAIQNERYANVAVRLYQALRDNYNGESQREFRVEAEYYFKRWSRINNYNQARRSGLSWYKWRPQHICSWCLDFLFGYGWKWTPILTTTFLTIVVMVIINFVFAGQMYKEPIPMDWCKATYFTLTTMTTLGAAGFTPDTDTGYIIVLSDVFIGIFLLSNVLSSIFKQIIQ